MQCNNKIFLVLPSIYAYNILNVSFNFTFFTSLCIIFHSEAIFAKEKNG